MLKRFQPTWAKQFGLSVYSRGTKGGGSTFALADEREGFPKFLLMNLPLRAIREFADDARHGERVLKRAHEKGLTLEDTSKVYREQIFLSAELGAFCRGERGAPRPQVPLRKLGPRRW